MVFKKSVVSIAHDLLTFRILDFQQLSSDIHKHPLSLLRSVHGHVIHTIKDTFCTYCWVTEKERTQSPNRKTY